MSIIDTLENATGAAGSEAAIVAGAQRIGCEEAVLRAILQVESTGDAYDAHGRLIILPEKHIFHRYLPSSLRGVALKRGLAATSWSRANYSGLGGSGSNARWRRLREMVELHEGAGLMAASYGKAQIMGFNHRMCGFAKVQDFVLALAESEDNQDEAFLRYLEGAGLGPALRSKDWSTIARRYNGSGQVTYYAGLMRTAYSRVKRSAPSASTNATPILRAGAKGAAVRELQQLLITHGQELVVDGDFGPITNGAVTAFQVEAELVVDGIVGPKTWAALKASA